MWMKKSAGETHSLRLADSSSDSKGLITAKSGTRRDLGSHQQQDAFKNQFGTGHKNNCRSSTVLSPAAHTEHSVL